MKNLWTLWLVGAGVGAVYGLFIALGQLFSSKRKKKNDAKTPDAESQDGGK